MCECVCVCVCVCVGMSQPFSGIVCVLLQLWCVLLDQDFPFNEFSCDRSVGISDFLCAIHCKIIYISMNSLLPIHDSA